MKESTPTHQNLEGENTTKNNQSDQNEIDQEDIKLDNSMRYEYYIHYVGIDRRNERWVTEHFIRIDD